ncbi:hypothetical protein LEMLEM_LOCUS14385 [Lemmus lemmus]
MAFYPLLQLLQRKETYDMYPSAQSSRCPSCLCWELILPLIGARTIFVLRK